MTLDELREKIDEVDNNLLGLYNKRLEYVLKVGKLKNSTNSPIYRPEREKEILERLKKINKEQNGKLSDKAIEALFLEMFSVARNYELAERVAYSNAKFGVVPIENSANGIVSDTISCLSEYNIKIVAEVVLDVHLVFASNEDDIKKIKRIYTKDIAFGQCKNFLEDFGLLDVEQIPVESTAKAAQLSKEDNESAAICAEIAAKLYNLPIQFKNIEDDGANRTRFFIISDFENEPSGKDKTTILAKLPNRPGALVDFLLDFKANQIDLTKIKSHIVEGSSIFFLEFNGHKRDKNISNIFEKHKESIKFLGSYVKEADDV